MKERDLTTKIVHWLREKHKITGAYEIKITKSGSIPFEALKEHQENALKIANNGSLCLKIPDCGWYNVFDVFCLVSVPAFVCVIFYKRGQREFWLIPIKNWIAEREASKRKSLTPVRAQAIGIRCEL